VYELSYRAREANSNAQSANPLSTKDTDHQEDFILVISFMYRVLHGSRFGVRVQSAYDLRGSHV